MALNLCQILIKYQIVLKLSFSWVMFTSAKSYLTYYEHLSNKWLFTFEISAVQLRSVTEIAPKSGADPGFFLGGGALVSCSTSTPINHIVFFCRIPVVLENRRSSQGGGGGAHPLHPPPRSAPENSRSYV